MVTKRQTLKQHVSSTFPRLSFSPSHQSPLPPPQGVQSDWSAQNRSLPLLPPHTFHLLLCGSFHRLKAIPTPVPWSTSFSSSSDLGILSAGLFLVFFGFFFLLPLFCLYGIFHSFLTVFAEAPASWLRDSAVP